MDNCCGHGLVDVNLQLSSRLCHSGHNNLFSENRIQQLFREAVSVVQRGS